MRALLEVPVPRKLITANEAKRNCMRVTDWGKEAWSEAASRWTRSPGPLLRALQSSGGRAGDGAAAAAVRQAALEGQRDQECGGQCVRAQVPGRRPVVGPAREVERGVSGNSRAARAGAAWRRWCRGCGPTCWAGRRTSGWRKRPRSGGRARRVAAPPTARDPAQAVEARRDDVPGTARLGRKPRGGATGSGQQPPLVAPSCQAAQ
jgi:hypothetical protein